MTAYEMRISDWSSRVLFRSDDADIVPHEATNLGPVLLDDDFLVRIGDAAFVPWADRGRRAQFVPVAGDMLRRRLAEDETFEQAVRRQAVRAVQPAFGHLARCVEAGQIGASVRVARHPAAGIMLRPHHPHRRTAGMEREGPD